MKFKLWIENQTEEIRSDFQKQKHDVALSYYDDGGWQTAALGDKYSAYIQKRKNKISIDNLSSYHPDARKITQDLYSILPEIGGYALNFDGHEVGTVNEFIGEEHSEYPEQWYHGTSTWHYEKIKEEGLQPRTSSGVSPSYFNLSAPAGEEDSVYLSGDDGNDVRFAARSAMQVARNAGHEDARPIILKIHEDALNPNKMKPDEDSDASNWKDSLIRTGTIRYIGGIRPQYIKPHMIWEKGWVKV